MESTMGTPPAEFNPDKAIDLWWREKTRRPNQTTRKKKGKMDPTDSACDTQMSLLLDDWDSWVDVDTD